MKYENANFHPWSDMEKTAKHIKFLFDNSGASLIEAVISLALIGIVIVILLTALSTGITTADRSRDNAYLLGLARSQLEDIYKQSYSDSHIYSLISPIPVGYAINVSVTVPATYTYASPGSGNTPETLQLITVTASGDWTSINLSGFKVKP